MAYPTVNTLHFGYKKTNLLMIYKAEVTVYSENHTQHVNAM